MHLHAQGAVWIKETSPSRYFDPPLTKRGQAQAHLAGQAISSLPHAFNAIYCSPQLRCLETAAPIAAQLGLVRNAPRTRCSRVDACDMLNVIPICSQKIVIVAGLSQCAAAIERAGLHRCVIFIFFGTGRSTRTRTLEVLLCAFKINYACVICMLVHHINSVVNTE
jgi:hypothetical protein